MNTSVTQTRNPQGAVKNWKEVYRAVQDRRKAGLSVSAACTTIGIAPSTFFVWKKRVARKKK
jgi:transposase-like protein